MNDRDNIMPDRLDEKLQRAQSMLRELGSVAVAFSAGADSTLVLKLAIDTLGPENVVAVTGRSDSLATAEFNHACELADALGAEHVILDTDEFDDPAYLANPTDRCYHCKTTLYSHLAAFIEQRGIRAVINGVNADDLGDFRPGIAASDEHQVRSPMAEAGMTKSDVRTMSQRLGLPTFDKPASPCLSSRVQYGESITPEKLRMIEAGEAFLRNELGVRECRVRHHDTLARIEVPADEIERLADLQIRSRIDSHFRGLGYRYITLDLTGFRSGSMNEVIPVESLTRRR